jgi:predicted ATP-dependent endonuclease of OLD family
MFTSVKFRNFKSLKDFTVRLRAINVLVGPNNAGNSTILDAFRAMAAAHKFASRRVQSPIESQLHFENLADDVTITVVPIGGFSQKQRIQDTAWAFEKMLKADISIAAVLDRDFRCNEEVAELVSDGRLFRSRKLCFPVR